MGCLPLSRGSWKGFLVQISIDLFLGSAKMVKTCLKICSVKMICLFLFIYFYFWCFKLV